MKYVVLLYVGHAILNGFQGWMGLKILFVKLGRWIDTSDDHTMT